MALKIIYPLRTDSNTGEAGQIRTSSPLDGWVVNGDKILVDHNFGEISCALLATHYIGAFTELLN